MKRVGIVVLALAMSSEAYAFCGFYVAGADTQLFNEATMVVMMRHGTTTVLSMQNDYKGPPESFAMVVPVPEVLEEDDVRTLPHHVFARIDQMAAPRLVEYWEQDPCRRPRRRHRRGGSGRMRSARRAAPASEAAPMPPPPVRIEAEFSVEEYDIVILSADDSSALDVWLRENGYSIPAGAAEALRPYVEQDMKFFVAKVDVEKVRWEGTGRNRRAVLSPLRMHYDSETFSLPVRLGMLNSAGTQDLIVHVLAEQQRYEVANMPNVTIPTNIVVDDATRRRFGPFYAALFDRTIAETGAVVTEYSWQASSCDPCPGPRLTNDDLMKVGGEVVSFDAVRPPGATHWQSNVDVEQSTLDPAVTEKLQLVGPVRDCHRQAFAGRRSDEVEGRVRLSVSTDGTSPMRASVVASTLPDAGRQAFETCLAERFAQSIAVVQHAGQGVVDLHVHTTGGRMASGQARLRNFVLTRLHYRYDRDDLADDLVFRPAPAIVGGRGVPRGTATSIVRGAPDPDDTIDGLLGNPYARGSGIDTAIRTGSTNAFQGRYIILHPWTGAMRCETPRRGRWGGPIRSIDRHPVSAAQNLGRVARGGIRLASFVEAPQLPAILPTPDATGYAVPSTTVRDTTLPPLPPQEPPQAPVVPTPSTSTSTSTSGGCGGCSTSGGSSFGVLLLLAFVLRCRQRGRR